MCADRADGEVSACLSELGQDSICTSASGQLIDAEDSHLLVGNTYPVKSQLASSKMVSSKIVSGYSKPKIKRKRGVWICEGDGLSVSGGDLQKVYRSWCEWVLARGRGLSL